MKNYFLLSLLFITTSALGRGTCDDLEVGEAIRVDIGKIGSKTNVEQKYTLKRISDSQYESYLNLDFKAHKKLNDSDVNIPEFKKYIRSCYEKFNHRLVDDKGRALSLKLFDESQDIDVPEPARVSLKIMPRNFRADSRSYNADIDCETVVHESLHLMGLGDEYVEDTMKLNPNLLMRIFNQYVEKSKKGVAFDCRAKGPVNSVMHNQWLLNSDVQVLFSGQMDTIIYPHCKSKNDEYYSCVRKAYRTSKENGSIGGCGNQKDICDTYNWVLSKDSPLRDTPQANMKYSERSLLKMQFLLNQ